MTAEEAEKARLQGIEDTTTEWINRIHKDWQATLGGGRDTMWLDTMQINCVPPVVANVVQHFRNLGYTVELEEHDYHYYTEKFYRLRVKPLAPKEPGVFKQMLSRLFGGQRV